MPIDLERLGTDLWLLDPTDQGSDRTATGDLHTALRLLNIDLATVSQVENMQQALLLRLLTPRGALEILGHPEYGSRLNTLIGEPNTEGNRNRAKMYVLESLAQEPRLTEILSVSVTTDRTYSPGTVDISVAAKVGESGEILNLVFPFSFG
jgi:phage baseplate assembly protein W